MRLLGIPFRNIRYNKSHNIITVTAVALTILTALCMSTLILTMNQSIEDYYRPLKNYDIILEKKGNIIQFLPLNSHFNDSIIQNLTKDIHVPFYPASFEFINETMQSIMPNALIGFPIAFMSDIMSTYELHGVLPADGKLEILEGSIIQIPPHKSVIGSNLSLFGKNFTVVGNTTFNNPILDNLLITSYSTFQSLFKLNGTCNEIFVPRNANVNESDLKQRVEDAYPFLYVLTNKDIDQISNNFIAVSKQWNSALPIFSVFITFSFSFSIFLLNVNKIKKDIRLLSSIGTKNTTIIGFKILENLILIFLGLAIGFIFAIFIYPIFTVLSFYLQQINTLPWNIYVGTFSRVLPMMASSFISIAIQMITIGLIATSLPHVILIHPFLKKNKEFNEKNAHLNLKSEKRS